MSAQQYLFLFTIGPVQSFIAQARKTRDLYAGSAILLERNQIFFLLPINQVYK
ncbi:MAG: hypothetical protein HGB26_04300 [Desulfobulbaceae bacterium]|nr:hypothetical protein [Desulfobulbaceae bacterium]